jgi:hypothetical protein
MSDGHDRAQPRIDGDSESVASREWQGEHILFLGAKRALIGGILAGGIALAGQFLIGRVYSGAEARRLLSAFIPAANSVGGTVVTASATILALMLAMLSLGRRVTGALDASFFRRIQRIALLCTAALCAGMLLLMFLSVPVQESQNVPAPWFTVVYYALIAIVATLVGLFIGMVLMLFNAIQSLIEVVRPNPSATAPSTTTSTTSSSPPPDDHQPEGTNHTESRSAATSSS